MREWGEGWNGGSSASEIVTTTTLDIITFPIQAPYLATHSGNYSPISADKQKRLMTSLENDPGIALKERWDLVDSRPQGKTQTQPDYSRRHVFVASFSNPNVKYSQEQIEIIYKNMPDVSDFVFLCRGCSTEFLVSHFEEAYTKAAHFVSWFELASIVSNPNTPQELVEKIASARNLPGGATGAAQQALYQRRSKSSTNVPRASP
jgi:hypothetical protein